jgi:hypothetical protein
MALPHYKVSKASSKREEPLYPNLYEVTLLPPDGIDGGLLLEHVNTVSGIGGVNPAIDAVGQKYKFADRSFAGMPSATSVDVTINFSLNFNDANQLYTYKTLREWYKKTYNPATGEMGLKKDYTGTIIIVQYNRKGEIWRKLTLFHVFPTGGIALADSLDYSTNDPVTLDIVFKCDHWEETLV